MSVTTAPPSAVPAPVPSPLYPPIEPFASGLLRVSDAPVHDVYYEQCGQRDGKPVLFLHGGPGGGTSADDRRYFDPSLYRIVLMDQRGSGKSLPAASLDHNTTWDLVADIEKLRKHLGIDKWVVFGGSWGSTLSLAYAQTHPDRVKGLVLRGIFLLGRRELEFFYQEGTSWMFPDEYDMYASVIPEAERKDLMAAYYTRLTSENQEERKRAAAAWSRWEMATCKLQVDEKMLSRAQDAEWADKFARIECHYFVNRGWFKEDQQLLKSENVDKIRNIPAVIVQGRYDMVCPARTAWDLHKAWPEASFVWVPDAGHSAGEAGTQRTLVEWCNRFREL